MDNLSPAQRSKVMGRIRSIDTKPEMEVRRLIYLMGYRYRLHQKDLPGTPDIVFRLRRKIILVHGCFWHRHENCRLARVPKSNEEFWKSKFESNCLRDLRNMDLLEKERWKVLVVWQCELRDLQRLKARMKEFLDA